MAGANCPLTAESSTEDFIFSSPYAVVKITAKSDNAEVIKSVVVKYGENNYTLNCGEGEALTSEGKDFFVAVKPATDAEIQVTFYTAEDKMATRNRKEAVTLAAKDLLPVEFDFVEDNWKVIPVTGVSIGLQELVNNVGEEIDLTHFVTFTPNNATNKNVTWSSSNTDVATVDSDGLVKSVAFGKAIITVTTEDGGKTATCKVKVLEKKTMSELLATNLNIPEAEDMTPPTNAWVNSTDPGCKAFIGVDTDGEKLFIFEKITQIDTVHFGLCMDDVFNRIDENTYKYVDEVATVTVKMTGGEFTSCECSFDITELQALYGTYASPVAIPTGALSGKFTVNAEGKKVYFSKGNLYYDGSAFKFEANQYDFPSEWNTSHVSHFFWSKDASVAYAETYSDGNATDSDVFFTNATTETAKSDFTVNGVVGKFRTLSAAEWTYLLETRTASTVNGTANARFAKATVNSKAGIILLPDTYTHPSGVTALTEINNDSWAEFTANSYNVTDWRKMESAGAVFLPAAGIRENSEIKYVGTGGLYPLSSANGSDQAYLVYFYYQIVTSEYYDKRELGSSVRLVIDELVGGTESYSNYNPDWFNGTQK